MCKHGGMEGKIRERAVKGRDVIGSLAMIMSGRSVFIVVKRELRNNILLLTLTYGSDGCDVTRWEGEL